MSVSSPKLEGPSQQVSSRADAGDAVADLARAVFEADWYVAQLEHDETAGDDPFAHFLQEGGARGLSPSRFFDSEWYLAAYPDVASDGVNPLLHYLEHGVEEGRNPSAEFHTRWYLEQNPDVAAAGQHPFVHYVEAGAAEGRLPAPPPDPPDPLVSAVFDTDWYLDQVGDPTLDRAGALRHFLEQGWRQGLSPHPLFDTRWYLDTYPEAEGTNPLLHYLERGDRRLRDPSPLFSANWYLSKSPDVAAAGANPLIHYLASGAAEGRSPCPIFDPSWYEDQLGDLILDRPALAHFAAEGAAAGLDPCALFDSAWYLASYPEAAVSGLPPAAHYLRIGAALGYDPSPLFSTRWYEQSYSDVVEHGVNPLGHYLWYGIEEERKPSPFHDVTLIGRLIANNDLKNASRLMGRGITGEEPRSIYVAAPASVLSYAERHGVLTPGPEEAADAADTLAPYVADLRGVTAIGGSRTLIGEDREILDDELTYSRQFPRLEPKSKVVRRVSDGRLLLTVSDPITPMLGAGVHLCHEYDGNYFHWVVEVLPKLLLSEGIAAAAALPLVVSADLPTNCYELMELVAGPERSLLKLKRDHAYRFERLVYPSDVCRIFDVYDDIKGLEPTVAPPGPLRQLARRVKAAVRPAELERKRRLYIRRRSNHRLLTNQRVLEESLVRRGFELVDMDGLSARTQVELFDQAEIVVSPSGAAVTNILWCQPGARVVVLASDHPLTNMTFWDKLAEAAHTPIRYVFGPRAHKMVGQHAVHDDFSIDPDALLAAIQGFSAV